MQQHSKDRKKIMIPWYVKSRTKQKATANGKNIRDE